MVSHVIGSGQRYLLRAPSNGQVRHKAFFKVGPVAGPEPTIVWHFQKYLGPRRHSSKEGRLRHQAINITPLKRVKGWGDSPLRPEGFPVPRRTRPDPCRWQHSRPTSDPTTGEAHQTRGFSQLSVTHPTERASLAQSRFYGRSGRRAEADKRPALPKIPSAPSAFPLLGAPQAPGNKPNPS